MLNRQQEVPGASSEKQHPCSFNTYRNNSYRAFSATRRGDGEGEVTRIDWADQRIGPLWKPLTRSFVELKEEKSLRRDQQEGIAAILRVIEHAEIAISSDDNSTQLEGTVTKDMDLSCLEPTPIGPNATLRPPIVPSVSSVTPPLNGGAGRLLGVNKPLGVPFRVDNADGHLQSGLLSLQRETTGNCAERSHWPMGKSGPENDARNRKRRKIWNEGDELCRFSEPIFNATVRPDLSRSNTGKNNRMNAISHHEEEDELSLGEKARFRCYQTDQWAERFSELLAFKAETGHCLVPHCFPSNPSLAQWIKRQRYQHKLKQEGRHCTLSGEREAYLEAAGFVWDSHQAAWREKFLTLKRYRTQHGNCRVPPTYLDRSLGVWVKCQRRQRKLFLNGEYSTMTEERIQLLDSLGFEWNPRGT